MTSMSGHSENGVRAVREPAPGVFRRLRAKARLGRRRDRDAAVRAIAEVCRAAAAGDLEARITSIDEGHELAEVARSINSLLDLTDAYVRESSASLRAANEGRYYRRFLERGMLGSFRSGARTINDASAEMKSKSAALEEAGEVMGRLAGGDFTARLEGNYNGPYARLQANLNSMAAELRQVVTRIRESSQVITGSGTRIQATSESLASAADETSRQVQAVSAASSQTGGNLRTVASAAETMSSDIGAISAQLQEAVAVATAAREQADRTRELMDALGQSSREIGAVVKLIAGIAQQTNLLALNAAIEAARAGNAGNSFGVVAHQVKLLAGQVTQATGDVSARIGDIQARTASAIDGIVAIHSVIDRINAISERISGGMQEQASTTAAIARNVADAAQGTAEVARSIGHVNGAAAETANGAADTLRDSEELAAVAAHLNALVSGFRV